MLAEWKRVLKPGGKIILELPCMDKVISYMASCIEKKKNMSIQMTWFALWGDPGHENVGMCHKWGYTKIQIMDVLRESGFINIAIENPRYHLDVRDMRAVAFKPLETV